MNKITILTGENSELKRRAFYGKYDEAMHKSIKCLALTKEAPLSINRNIQMVFVDEVDTVENMKRTLESATQNHPVEFVISTILTKEAVLKCMPEDSELVKKDPQSIGDVLREMLLGDFTHDLIESSAPKHFKGLQHAIDCLQKAKNAGNKSEFLNLLKDAAQGIANEASHAIGEEPEEVCGECTAHSLLRELVELKELKNEQGKTIDYLRRKDIAWKNAIEFIRS